MDRYNVVLAEDEMGTDDKGKPVVVRKAGTVLNTVLWDGETPYDPGDGVELVLVEDAPPPQKRGLFGTRK